MRGSDRRPGARAARRPFNQAGEPTTPTAATNFDASNRLSIDSAAYNAAGNQTAIAGFTNTFDAENRLLTSTLGGVTTTYTYDGDGRRVQKATGGATTTYVYDAAGDLAAEYSTAPPAPPCTTCYLTEDHLGSTRMMTDASGALKSLHDYVPFGEEIQAGVGGRSSTYYPPGSLAINDTVAQKFTGKERDAETGLDYFGARYFGSPQGRFTIPDWSAKEEPVPYAKLEDPQSLNLYAYVKNNPLRFADPTGHVVGVDDAVEILTVGTMFVVAYYSLPPEQRDFTKAATAVSGAVATFFKPKAKEKTTSPTPTRGQALGKAKQDAGVPQSQQPEKQANVPLTDQNGKQVVVDGKPQTTREYTHTTGSGDTVVIQDHAQGHSFPDGGSSDSHMHVRPPEDTRQGTVDGTQSHYPYK